MTQQKISLLFLDLCFQQPPPMGNRATVLCFVLRTSTMQASVMLPTCGLHSNDIWSNSLRIFHCLPLCLYHTLNLTFIFITFFTHLSSSILVMCLNRISDMLNTANRIAFIYSLSLWEVPYTVLISPSTYMSFPELVEHSFSTSSFSLSLSF